VRGIGRHRVDRRLIDAERRQLDAKTRRAVSGAVHHRCDVGGELAFTRRKRRWASLDGAVQLQPLHHDLGIEAAEHRELGGLAEALGLPVVGFLEQSGGICGVDSPDPGHGRVSRPQRYGGAWPCHPGPCHLRRRSCLASARRRGPTSTTRTSAGSTCVATTCS
jgi:hypothetical protein